MGEIRQTLLSFDESFKLLGAHYDAQSSTLLKNLTEQTNQFEKRWSQLIDQLEQCSTQVSRPSLCLLTLDFLSIS